MKSLLVCLLAASSLTVHAGPARRLGRAFARELAEVSRAEPSRRIEDAVAHGGGVDQFIQAKPYPVDPEGDSLEAATQHGARAFVMQLSLAETAFAAGDRATARAEAEKALLAALAVYTISAHNGGNRLTGAVGFMGVVGFVIPTTLGTSAVNATQLYMHGLELWSTVGLVGGVASIGGAVVSLRSCLRNLVNGNASIGEIPFIPRLGRSRVADENVESFWHQVNVFARDAEAEPGPRPWLRRLATVLDESDLGVACERALAEQAAI
jgi:hypothetical protein